MTEQSFSRTDQAEEVDTTHVLDNTMPAVVYSQRYDGTIPY